MWAHLLLRQPVLVLPVIASASASPAAAVSVDDAVPAHDPVAQSLDTGTATAMVRLLVTQLPPLEVFGAILRCLTGDASDEPPALVIGGTGDRFGLDNLYRVVRVAPDCPTARILPALPARVLSAPAPAQSAQSQPDRQEQSTTTDSDEETSCHADIPNWMLEPSFARQVLVEPPTHHRGRHPPHQRSLQAAGPILPCDVTSFMRGIATPTMPWGTPARTKAVVLDAGVMHVPLGEDLLPSDDSDSDYVHASSDDSDSEADSDGGDDVRPAHGVVRYLAMPSAGESSDVDEDYDDDEDDEDEDSDDEEDDEDERKSE